jgi:hypothetical protein
MALVASEICIRAAAANVAPNFGGLVLAGRTVLYRSRNLKNS